MRSSGIVTATARKSSDFLYVTIPAKLTDRWPVGSWIDIFQFNHKDVTIAFDNPSNTVVELAAVGTGGAVPAGTLLNNVVYFRLARLTTAAIEFLPHARGIR